MKKTMLFLIFVALFAFLAGGMVWAAGGASLKGKSYVLGSFWENYNVNTQKPTDELGEQILEYRKKVLKDNQFNFEVKQVADWGGMLETMTTSIMAGKPAASAFYVVPDWAMALLRQNLLYPVGDSKAVNLKTSTDVIGKQIAYNQDVGDIFTFNGKQYAFAIGYGSSAHDDGLYFNKRLFREAGLSPDHLYDMQKAGTWTWANFLDLCKRLTRDRNNTGRIDTYALTADPSGTILNCLVYSNNANWITRDAQGRFQNATSRPEFLEALQFAIRLNNEGIMMPRPDGSNWDWFFSQFTDGNIAMMFGENWRAGQLMEQMQDDWGYVAAPKGPKAQNYRFGTDENVFVVPSTFKPAEVDEILFAIDLWYKPLTDNWKDGNLNRYRDRRAIDETLVMTRDPKFLTFKNWLLIPGLQLGDIAWQMWWFEGEPAQLVESVSQSWNATIEDANVTISTRR